MVSRGCGAFAITEVHIMRAYASHVRSGRGQAMRCDAQELPLLLLFLTFSALVANPKKTTLHGVANPARGLLNREKKKKEKIYVM